MLFHPQRMFLIMALRSNILRSDIIIPPRSSAVIWNL